MRQLVILLVVVGVLGTCLCAGGSAALYLVLREGSAKPSPGTETKTPGTPPRMETFYARNKRTETPLSLAQVEKLEGSWEARYVSFVVDGARVDTEALPPLVLAIEAKGSGATLKAQGSSEARSLSIEGATLRAAPLAMRGDLVLRLDGDEIVGEIAQAQPKVQAEFRAKRK